MWLIPPLQLFLLLLTVVPIAITEQVLFLYPNASPSHKNVALPIMLGLAERGHKVTVVSAFKTEPHKNLRDILPFQSFDYFPEVNALDLRRQGLAGLVLADYSSLVRNCDTVYKNQDFIHLLREKFDVVFTDIFSNECMLGFAHVLGAPYIIISPLPVPSYFSAYTGNRLPPSFVPNFVTDFSHDMTFVERATNMIKSVVVSWGMRRYLPDYEALYKKYLGADLPSVDELLANMSMILVNSHFSFNYPRPTMPDVVEIGAIHCRPGEPLPKELNDFVSGAKDGFILFSLGSVVKPQDIPEQTRRIFLNVFSRLKQRILWKWPTDMPDAPPNVNLLNWIPQQDVLAHPNIRLFITHAGLLSTQESIYHGVPMVAIPFFGDQDLNARGATGAGISEKVEILDIIEDSLESAIHKVLTNVTFKENIAKMATYLKDQTEAPKDRAIFWTEYVMRHKGARHLRSAARELNFFQYHSLDVGGVICGTVVGLLLLVILGLKKLLCRFSSVDQFKVKKMQ